jgi:hypothetical protein
VYLQSFELTVCKLMPLYLNMSTLASSLPGLLIYLTACLCICTYMYILLFMCYLQKSQRHRQTKNTQQTVGEDLWGVLDCIKQSWTRSALLYMGLPSCNSSYAYVRYNYFSSVRTVKLSLHIPRRGHAICTYYQSERYCTCYQGLFMYMRHTQGQNEEYLLSRSMY